MDNTTQRISADDLARLARLARLHITAEESPSALKAIDNILNMMARLQQVDVSGEDALSHVQFFGATLRLREDKAIEGYSPEELTAAAPQHQANCFIVPAVIE